MSSLQIQGPMVKRLKTQSSTEKVLTDNVSQAALSYWQELFNNHQLSPPECKYLYPDLNSVENEAVKELLTYKLTQEMSVIAETDWSGSNAVGLTAFWLKVLSEPTIPQLKKCKIAFISKVVEHLSNSRLFTLCSVASLEDEGSDDSDKNGERDPISVDQSVNVKNSQNVPIATHFTANPGMLFQQNEFQRAQAHNHLNNTNPFTPPLKHSQSGSELGGGGIKETFSNTSTLMAGVGYMSSIQRMGPFKLTAGEMDLPESLLYQEDGKPFPSSGESAEDEEATLWTEALEGEAITFSCKTCHYKSTYKSRIKQHMRSVHSTVKPYKCEFCDHTTAIRASLTKHVNAVHRQSRPFSCTLCSYTCNLKRSLEVHITGYHQKQYKYTCQFCDYAASSKNVVDIHVQAIHMKEKPYKCPHCEYSSAYPQYIPKHIAAVHERQKPFACPHCPYRSSYKTYLQKHCDAVHNNIKPYACPHCPYITSYSQYLTKHISAVHNDEKPHKCPLCQFRCAYKQYINKHIELVHAGAHPPPPLPHAAAAENGREKPLAPPSVKEELKFYGMPPGNIIPSSMNTASSMNSNMTSSNMNSISSSSGNMTFSSVSPNDIKTMSNMTRTPTGSFGAGDTQSKGGGSVFPGDMRHTSAHFGSIHGAMPRTTPTSSADFIRINNMLRDGLANNASLSNNFSMSNDMFLGNISSTAAFTSRESSTNGTNSLSSFPTTHNMNNSNYSNWSK